MRSSDAECVIWRGVDLVSRCGTVGEPWVSRDARIILWPTLESYLLAPLRLGEIVAVLSTNENKIFLQSDLLCFNFASGLL